MKKLLFALPIIALLAAGCNSSQQASVKTQAPVTQNTNPTPTQTPTSTQSQNSTTNDLANANTTVTVFMNDMNSGNYNDAVAKLSVKGQAFVNLQPQQPNSIDTLKYGLYGFIAIPSLPDKGMSIVSSQKLNNTTIKVSTQWSYSGTSKPSTKTFTLIFENGQWQIDKVQ
jgi:hypothetical protein